MMLAHPLVLEKDLTTANPKDFIAEYKWDGIRIQIVSYSEGCRLYSRTGDEVTKSFPEIVKAIKGNFVLDGELLAGVDNKPRTFNDLQQRLNKKAPAEKFIKANPCFIKVYDILFFNGIDLRDKTLIERKKILNSYFGTTRSPLFLSETIKFTDWEELDRIRDISDSQIHEGVMIKLNLSSYIAGRPRGKWFKWKRNPKTVDAIIMYAQRGHGKRSSFYSDYTFGVLNKEEELVPIGKAYSGFTDEELNRLDKFVRTKTIKRFGPVREVEKTLVVEIAFDAISLSKRHKSGVALRFPRFKRIRWDKPTSEVETLEQIRKSFLK
jgi:DNA ligase-1